MHEPFPIADFRAGQFSGKEPWLSPSSAFQTLTDGRIYRGRLEKRTGFSRLSELGSSSATPINGTGTGPTSNAFYLAPHSLTADGRFDNIVAETVVFSWTDASSAVLQAKINMSGYPVDTTFGAPPLNVVDFATGSVFIGTYLIGTGEFNLNWTLHPDITGFGPNRGTMAYVTPANDPVTGITSFTDADGAETLLAFDTNSIYVLNNTTQSFLKDPTVVVLTGTPDDYVWSWPFDDYLMFTNNVDPVYKYTPGGSPTVEQIDTEFDSGSGGNDLDTCLLVMRYKGRAIFFNTKENGTRYPRRARWSLSGAFEVHDTTGLAFADAPSHLGSIVTGQMIADRIFIGFELGWMELVDTNESTQPFRWEVTTARRGSISKMATIADSYRLLHRTEYAIESIDPNGQYRVDDAIPDFILQLDASKRGLGSGARNDPFRSFWWSYARAEDDYPGRVLAAQYDAEDKLSWSVYRMAFDVFGLYSNVQPSTWDSFDPRTWDQLDFSWDSARGSTGFRSLVGGTRDGVVYIFDDSTTDAGAPIVMEAKTQALSPYPGTRAHLGWIDIYASAAAGATLSIGWSRDNRAAVEKTMTVDLTPDVVTNNVYRRVLINKVATFHTLTLTLESESAAAIDAVVPWFKAVSRPRKFA